MPVTAVIALILVAFLPLLGNGFIPNWDDHTNVPDNPHYRGWGPAQLRWMFTAFHAGHYIPLTWLSLGLDHLLWGLRPGWYALTLACLAAALLSKPITVTLPLPLLVLDVYPLRRPGGRAAHADLADALEKDGRPGEAIPYYVKAMRRSLKAVRDLAGRSAPAARLLTTCASPR